MVAVALRIQELIEHNSFPGLWATSVTISQGSLEESYVSHTFFPVKGLFQDLQVVGITCLEFSAEGECDQGLCLWSLTP